MKLSFDFLNCDGCIDKTVNSDEPAAAAAASSIFNVAPHPSFRKVQRPAPNVAAEKGDTPEDMIAAELNRLSINERQDVHEEVHGVKQVEESPAFVDECLVQLTKELKRISTMRDVYSRALFLNPKYVKDRKFELMFLRSDEYDPKKAATRMLYHFEKKLEIYGHKLLTRDIRYTDLHPKSIQDIKQGTSCSSQLFMIRPVGG